MAFNDQELLHGAAILRLIESGHTWEVKHAASIHESAYIVLTDSMKSIVMFKLSKRTKSPWQFVFTPNEEQAVQVFHRDHCGCPIFFGLVCQKDGVCCVTERELDEVMPENGRISELYVSISRKRQSSYRMSGPSRTRLDRTIQAQSWPNRLFERAE